MIDPRLLQQFFRDPSTGQPAMLPGAPGAPQGGGGVAQYGIPMDDAYEMDGAPAQGVKPPPGYGRAPSTGMEGAYGPPPQMPAPPSGGPGSFMPMAAPGGTGGMQAGPYSGPPPSMSSGPYSGPPPTMTDGPTARHPTQVVGDLVNQFAEQRKAQRGDPTRDARSMASGEDPSMMDDEKRQRLIQAILRARGML